MPPPNAPQSSRSNGLVVDIRDRMPFILATRDYARWLGDEPDPGNLMQPFPANSILESVELAGSGRTL
jgi:putative SOS response-associated peptidase YedK